MSDPDDAPRRPPGSASPPAEPKAVDQRAPDEPGPDPESDPETGPDPESDSETEPDPETEPRSAGLARFLELLRPRANRAQAAVGALCLLVGFAVAAQARANRADTEFATARQEELVGVLDNLSQRSQRLRGDIQDLERTKSELERDGQGVSAVEEARRRATTYGLLAGTLPATGPGIELTISDPGRKVTSAVLLDALQELRDAGAEVVQINDIRVGVDTYFLDSDGGVTVDRNWVQPPYRFLVIGDPRTLAAALDIPGGVIETIRNAGATGRVTQRAVVEIQAVRSPGSGRAGGGD